jgi:hypothetical protein
MMHGSINIKFTNVSLTKMGRIRILLGLEESCNINITSERNLTYSLTAKYNIVIR